MTQANGAASAAPLAVREDATPAQLSVFETQVVAALEQITDVNQAERLLAAVKTAEGAARHVRLGKREIQRWRGYLLKAEALYGKLLGPGKAGGQTGNRNAVRNDVSTGHIVPDTNAARQAAKQARKVAAVQQADPKGFNDYVEKDPKPSREGLLRQAKPATGPRSTSWNGKTIAGQARENKERRRTLNAKQKNDYGDLLALQLAIDKVVVTLQSLENIRARDYVMDEAEWALVDSIHDDLITLGEVHDRALGKVQAWLGDAKVLDKIRKTAVKTVRNGATAEEAKNAIRAVRRMRRKLNNKLSK